MYSVLFKHTYLAQGVSVIKTAEPPERGFAIALSVELNFAILPNVENSGVEFLVVEDCVRAILFSFKHRHYLNH